MTGVQTCALPIFTAQAYQGKGEGAKAKELAAKSANANVLPLVSSDTRYVDVSVPERPVSGSELQPATPSATPSATPTTSTPSAPPEAGTSTTPTLKSQVEGKVATSTGP